MKKDYCITYYHDPESGTFDFIALKGNALPPEKLKGSPMTTATIQGIANGPERGFLAPDQRKNGWCFTKVPHLYDEAQAKKLMDRICADPWTIFLPVLYFHATKVRGLDNG